MTKIKFQRDARPAFDVSETYAVALIDRLLTGSNIFSVSNIKADGSARKYLVCPKAYRAEIKGTGTKLDVVKNAMLRRIPDMHAETGGGTKAHWRTLNMATVFAVEAEGATFNVVR